MSLESQIENLTAAVENLAFIIKQSAAMSQKPLSNAEKYDAAQSNLYAPLRTDDEVKPNPVVVIPAPMPVHTVPVGSAEDKVFPQTAPAVAMPPVPTFVTPPPAPAVAQTKAPFSDAKGLMDYLMRTYGTLGPEKGAKIQEVMKSLGANAVNEVTPDKYDALFAGVEALK